MKKAKGHKGQKPGNLTSKPLCDCAQQCSCSNCPDIKEVIGLPEIKTQLLPKTKRGLKANKKLSQDSKPKKASKSKVLEVRRPSLLDVMRNDQGCNCEATARAVRSDVHKNLDIHERARTSKDLDNKTKPI